MVDKCKLDSCDNDVERKRGGQIFCSRDCRGKFHNAIRRGERREYQWKKKIKIPERFLVRGTISTHGRASIWNVS